MNKEKIVYSHEDGSSSGIYMNAGNETALVVIVNGHNGFYNYGMFPYIQQTFYDNKISSYSFNYSHGGVIGDGDTFEDLFNYEKNCMRLEVADLLAVLSNIKNSKLSDHHQIFLLAHSMGGIPAIFGGNKFIEEGFNLDGIILASCVSTLNFWPPDVLNEWSNAGVFYRKNNRINQELPLGFDLLQETLKSDTEWNVERQIKKMNVPFLIIHGENDEAVSLSHGEKLFSWIKGLNSNSKFETIKGATHTFNTKHPFTQSSIEVDKLISSSISWIHSIINPEF